MKKFLIQFVLLITVIAVAILVYNGSIFSLPFLPEQAKYSELIVNGVKLKVEVADTQEKRSKGLGGRESLASDSGMLFIFAKEDKYPFWMKGLKFPLDFVWIRGDKVVDILENIPPPASGTSDESLPIYQPTQTIDKVLEANVGTVGRLKIKVGDSIKLNTL